MKDSNADLIYGHVFVEEVKADPVEQCLACHGLGELPVPHTYKTCPCCKGREKIRPCRQCSGRGYK